MNEKEEEYVEMVTQQIDPGIQCAHCFETFLDNDETVQSSLTGLVYHRECLDAIRDGDV